MGRLMTRRSRSLRQEEDQERSSDEIHGPNEVSKAAAVNDDSGSASSSSDNVSKRRASARRGRTQHRRNNSSTKKKESRDLSVSARSRSKDDDEEEENEGDEEEEQQQHTKNEEEEHEEEEEEEIKLNAVEDSADEEEAEDQDLDFDGKICELENRSNAIIEGKDNEYLEKSAMYEKEKNHQFNTAEWHKKLQLKNVHELFEYKVHRAEYLHMNAMEQLQERMVAKVEGELKRLREELRKVEESHETKKQKVVQLVEPKQSSNDEAAALSKDTLETFVNKLQESRKNMSKVFDFTRLKDNVLKPTEAFDDLKKIHNHWKSVSNSIEAEPQESIQFENGVLHYRDHAFQSGDEVIVSSRMVGEDYVGCITSITNEAVYIQLEGGPKARVYLTHLRTIRCTMEPRRVGKEGRASLDERGWVNCEVY